MSSFANVYESSGFGISLPRFGLRLGPLKTTLEEFQSQFDATLRRENSELIQEQREFRNKLAECTETERLIQSDINEYISRDAELANQRTSELQELQETRSAISSYQSKRDELLQKHDKYEQEIAQLKKQIDSLKADKEQTFDKLNAQSNYNSTELQYWEELLGLRIEGVKEDFLKFIYSNLDASSSQCYFILDMSGDEYKVSECEPKIDSMALNANVERLNQTRQVGIFLRDMRRDFKSFRTGAS